MQVQQVVPLSLPVVISREGKWFVASCPLLDIGTQGKTENEARENMQDLIKDYFSGHDAAWKKLALESLKRGWETEDCIWDKMAKADLK